MFWLQAQLKNNFYASLFSEDIRLVNYLRNSSPVLKFGFKYFSDLY